MTALRDDCFTGNEWSIKAIDDTQALFVALLRPIQSGDDEPRIDRACVAKAPAISNSVSRTPP
jgi:hypothetical protein